MKKKIGILGSTGSIGENTVKIIQNNKKDFDVIFLSTNTNIKKLHQSLFYYFELFVLCFPQLILLNQEFQFFFS